MPTSYRTSYVYYYLAGTLEITAVRSCCWWCAGADALCCPRSCRTVIGLSRLGAVFVTAAVAVYPC